VIVKLLSEAHDASSPIGVDCSSGEAVNPSELGIYDNYNVKRQVSTFLAIFL
jgi:T-complex protein 1 subunit zeta